MSDRPVLGNDPFRRGAAERKASSDPAGSPEEADASGPAEKRAPAAKKAASRKRGGKKAASAKKAASKAGASKKASAKKASAKKASSKKAASKKAGTKKAASKKPSPKGAAAKQASSEKAAPKKPSDARAKGPPTAAVIHHFPAPSRVPAEAPQDARGENDSLETGPDAVPLWVRTAAATVYHDDYAAPAAPRRTGGNLERALAEAADLQDALGKAVRAAGMGGAHVLEVGEELARSVGRAEQALRSLLGPGLATEIHDAAHATLDALRHQILGMGSRRRYDGRHVRNLEVVDDFGLDPTQVERWRPILEAIYERWFRVEARGVEHVPSEGRCLLVCNHAGALPWDALMVKTAVEREHPDARVVRPLMDDFIFHFPFMGTFLNRYGAVRACQENAERLLAQDRLVAVFPEGLKGLGKPYAQRYRLQRFGRGGFVKLSLRAGAPIVPVAIVGSEDVHPILFKITFLVGHLGLPYLPVTPTFPLLGPLGMVPLPSKWHLEFGEPIDLSEYGPDAADDRILVNRLSDQVRSRIQSRVDALRLLRRNALM
jgi:1-acyl-sn-glycerol-3-phosphate acyltransferase